MTGREWDIVVIGAGPAGASAAYSAASTGARTMLLDKARFPRNKPCGGCLNAAAINTLHDHGLLSEAPVWSSSTYSTLRLACRGRQADIAVAPGLVVDRAEFDAWLVKQAIGAGAEFRDATSAKTEPDANDDQRRVTLCRAGLQTRVTASAVVLATGLAKGAQDLPAWHVIRGSKIGLHAIIRGTIDPGTIEMAVGRGGYVGAAQLTDGRLDIGAAVRPESLRVAGSAAELLNFIRTEAGLAPFAGLHAARISGTPPLTRRRTRVADRRLLLVGDAAGYVEPFTGEGIAWALASGFAAGKLAARACRNWSPAPEKQWTTTHRRLIGRRQRACRLVRAALSHPRLVSAVVALAGADAEFASGLASFASRRYAAGVGP